MLSPSSGNTIIKSKLISRRMFLLTAAKGVVLIGIIGRLVSLQINERTKYASNHIRKKKSIIPHQQFIQSLISLFTL